MTRISGTVRLAGFLRHTKYVNYMKGPVINPGAPVLATPIAWGQHALKLLPNGISERGATPGITGVCGFLNPPGQPRRSDLSFAHLSRHDVRALKVWYADGGENGIRTREMGLTPPARLSAGCNRPTMRPLRVCYPRMAVWG